VIVEPVLVDLGAVGRKGALPLGRIIQKRPGQLPHVAGADERAGVLARLDQRRQQQRDQDRDHANHRQQLNERKAPAARMIAAHAHGRYHTVRRGKKTDGGRLLADPTTGSPLLHLWDDSPFQLWRALAAAEGAVEGNVGQLAAGVDAAEHQAAAAHIAAPDEVTGEAQPLAQML
jgi:hypothetical protein